MTFKTVFRHSPQNDHSDYRSINPDFILVSIFSTCHSVATRQLVDSWLFPTCYTPRLVSLSDKSVVERLINTCLVVAKPHLLYTLMGARTTCRGRLHHPRRQTSGIGWSAVRPVAFAVTGFVSPRWNPAPCCWLS